MSKKRCGKGMYGVKNKCKHISKGLENFFGVEIRNEDLGGVSPSTLSSAYDSWVQAPDYVLLSWTKTKSRKDLKNIEKELEVVMSSLGRRKKLQDIIEDW